MKKLSILLVILLIGFPQLSETIYTPALPNLTESLHTTATLAEFTLSIYFIGFALGVLLWGSLSDHYGRRPMLLLGIVIYIIGTFLCGISQSVTSLLTWRLLQAFGASTGSVITQTMMRDISDGTKRNQIFSIVGGALAFAPAVGPFVGGFLSDNFGWTSNFFFLLIIGITILGYSWIRLPETRPAHTDSVNFREICKLAFQMIVDKNILKHAILIGSCNGIIFSFYGEAPFIFINILNFNPKTYGILGIVIASATIVSSTLSHRLNESKMPSEIIKWGVLSTIGGSSTIFLMTILEGVSQGTHPFTITCYIGSLWTIFFGVGLIISNSLGIALKDYTTKVGSAGSLFGMLYYVLISLFTGLMGFIHNGTAFPMSLLFLLLSMGMFIIFNGTTPRCIHSDPLECNRKLVVKALQ